MRAACDEARRTGVRGLEASAQLALGGALIGAGTARHQDGELALHRAITFAREADEPSLAASAYRHLAASDVLRGIYGRADRRLEAATAGVAVEAASRVELAAIGGVSLLDQVDLRSALNTFTAGLVSAGIGAARRGDRRRRGRPRVSRRRGCTQPTTARRPPLVARVGADARGPHRLARRR
jgi:hypothetical protein